MSKCNCNCKNNGSGCRNKHEYSRIRDLPEDEQEWEVSGWQSRKDISKLMIDHG